MINLSEMGSINAYEFNRNISEGSVVTAFFDEHDPEKVAQLSLGVVCSIDCDGNVYEGRLGGFYVDMDGSLNVRLEEIKLIKKFNPTW